MKLPNDKWKEIPGRPYHYEYVGEVRVGPRPDAWIKKILEELKVDSTKRISTP